MSETDWIDDFIRGAAKVAARRHRGEPRVEPDPHCPACHGKGQTEREMGDIHFSSICECTFAKRH
jgi:hypothetical protein